MRQTEPFTGGNEDEILAWIVRRIDWTLIETWVAGSPDTLSSAYPLCSWEDDGQEHQEVYSGANAQIHQSRGRAQRIVKPVRGLALERIPSLEFRPSAAIADA